MLVELNQQRGMVLGVRTETLVDSDSGSKALINNRHNGVLRVWAHNFDIPSRNTIERERSKRDSVFDPICARISSLEKGSQYRVYKILGFLLVSSKFIP